MPSIDRVITLLEVDTRLQSFRPERRPYLGMSASVLLYALCSSIINQELVLRRLTTEAQFAMRLIKALEIALELHERGEIDRASQEVKDTIYRRCAGTEPDLYYYLFDSATKQGLSEVVKLTDEGMKKMRKGLVEKIKSAIQRHRKRNLHGRRGDALIEIVCILMEKHIAVDEDDEETLRKLRPFTKVLMETCDYPRTFPTGDQILKALDGVDEEVYDLIMGNVFFIKEMMERQSQLSV